MRILTHEKSVPQRSAEQEPETQPQVARTRFCSGRG